MLTNDSSIEQQKRQLGRRLDKLVSLYVRKQEKRCFTCGKRLRKRDRQAGHYIPRGVQALRWDLDNVHVQCAHCNVTLGGNIPQYRKKLEPNVRQRLDHAYDMYKIGRLPAPNFIEMKMWHNVLCKLLHLEEDEA